jgi:hypothetical protein
MSLAGAPLPVDPGSKPLRAGITVGRDILGNHFRGAIRGPSDLAAFLERG